MIVAKVLLLMLAFLFVWAGSASYLFAFTSEEDQDFASAQSYRNGFRGYNGVALLISFIAGAI